MSARHGALAFPWLVALGAATGTLGCKKLLQQKLAATDAGTATTSSRNSPQDDLDEALQDKLEGYITCLNTLEAPVRAARVRYFSWVAKTGPTGQERNVLGLFKLPNDKVQNCITMLVKSKARDPKDATLEAAGEELARALTDRDALISDLFPYYDKKTFKDDKLAKGKATHPKLVAAFASFAKAASAMHAKLDAVTKPLGQRTLARIEREEGRKFRFHRRRVLLSALELIEAANPAGDDDAVDVALYESSFGEMDKALSDLQEFGVLHTTELDGRDTPTFPFARSNFDRFSRAADDYRKTARENLRCLRDASPRAKRANGKVDPDGIGSCVDGRPRDVLQRYNDFVRISNERVFP